MDSNRRIYYYRVSMDKIEFWKSNKKKAMSRLTAFWNRRLKDRILADFSGGVPNQTWLRYVRKRGFDDNPMTAAAYERPCLCESDPATVLEVCDARMSVFQNLSDDSIPHALPTHHYSSGIVGGLLGGQVKFVGTDIQTWSVSEPMLRDYKQVVELQFDDQNPWAASIRHILRKTAAHADGRYGLHLHGTMDALNLAVELRGATQAYIDIYEHPQGLRELMDFGSRLNVWWKQMEQDITLPHNLSVFHDDAFARLSYGAKPYISVDAYTECAPEVYRDMGREYHRRLINEFQGGFVHTHGCGIYRLLPELAKLTGVLMMQVGNDGMRPDEPEPIDRLAAIQAEITHDIPLTTSCSFDRFMDGLSRRNLPGNVLYRVDGCPSITEANRLMPRVVDYIAPSVSALS